MKCKDVKNILFAFVDGDIDEQERRAISVHLKACPGCRSVLVKLKSTREKLVMLRETPVLPELQTATIQEKAARNTRSRINWILLPTVIALPIFLILTIVFTISFTGGASEVLAKAYAATEKIESYRTNDYLYTHFISMDEPILTAFDQSAFSGNDNYQLKYYPRGDDYYSEIIVVDGQRYLFGYHTLKAVTATYFEKITPTKQKTMDYLDLITNVETLQDETINGTECYHYKGMVSTEKWLERELSRAKEYYKNSPMEVDMLKYLSNYWRNREIRYDLWVGKDDFLIRQVKEYTNLVPTGFYETILILNYYDFNKAIYIEPPLDENGELLDGWVIQDIEN